MRPRFLDELVCAPFKDGLVLDGGERPRSLQGKTAQSLIPKLIKLMDGTRTLKELEIALPVVASQNLRAAISLMYSSGLIEDGEADEKPIAIENPDTLAFFRRYVGVTRMNRSGQEAYRKLQNAETVIVEAEGRSDHCAALKFALTATGVGKVTEIDRKTLQSWRREAGTPSSQTLIVSMSLDHEDCEWHSELDVWCREHRLTWLRAALDQPAGHFDLGPLFDHNEDACYRCFRGLHLTPSRPQSSAVSALAAPEPALWASLVATEVIYLLSGIGPTPTRRDFRRYDLRNWTSQPFRYAGLPGCTHCRPVRPELQRLLSATGCETVLDPSLVFEDYVVAQSRSVVLPKEHQEPANVALTRESKSLENCPAQRLKTELPKFDCGALEVLQNRKAQSASSLTIDDLAALLMFTAGIRDRQGGGESVKRWAATAGNLGSVELYLAVRNVVGLAPGFYFYQRQDHSLASFHRRHGGLEVEDFMRRVKSGKGAEMADVLVLFTGAFHRVSRKYGAFGYRLLNLDAGAAASQMHMIAGSLGISSRNVPRWSDDLIEDQLHLNPFHEQSTAVVALSCRATTHMPEHEASVEAIAPGKRSLGKAPGALGGVPVSALTEMVYRESRVKENELEERPHSVPEELLDESYGGGFALSLPAASQGGLLVGDVLARRRSGRSYTPEPMNLSHLGTMLDCAHMGDLKDWPEEHRCRQQLTLVVLAWNVAGVEPGTYLYDPQSHVLRFLRVAPPVERRADFFIQDDFAAASAVVWIFGNLAAASARHGAFGHRQLLLRAGAAGHRASMAAAGVGLAGCLVAGVVAGEARRQFGFDGYTRASLLAFATGYGSQGPK